MDDPTKDTIPRSAVEYCLRKESVSTNPEKYKTHEKFIDYMNDPDISEFGHWMHSNGFNCALTAISVDLEKIPSVTPSAQPERDDCDTCKHGFFGSVECNNCRVRYPSHWESREGGQ